MHNLPIDDFDIKSLTLSIKQVYENLTQPHLFAQTFCAAAESQKLIEGTLKKTIRDLIKTDSETLENLEQLIEKIERKNLILLLKKVGFSLWGGMTFALGVIVTIIITHYLQIK